jgi:hypothetical protein
MNGGETIKANNAVELAKHSSRCGFAPKVVSGREDVCRVEANAEPFRLPHIIEDVGNLFEGVTERGALPGGGF